MKKYFKDYKYLDIPDVTNFLFLILLSVLTLLFVDIQVKKYLIILGNLLLVLGINYVIRKYEVDKVHTFVIRTLRFWYPVIMILICFKEIYLIMLYSAEGVLMDGKLIEIDRMIFGGDPTHFLAKFSNPWFNEFMQIIYSVFYVLPIIVALQLYSEKRYDEFKYFMFVVFLAFYISFIGYLLVPAVGPRFMLHDFHTLDLELPGVFISESLRSVINFVESIPKGVPNPEDYAQRDAFPSGHTIIIILITYMAYLFHRKRFYLYLVYCILMIFSTVYLRYHYVIDLIAAVPVVLITIFVANHLYRKKLNFLNPEN